MLLFFPSSQLKSEQNNNHPSFILKSAKSNKQEKEWGEKKTNRWESKWNKKKKKIKFRTHEKKYTSEESECILGSLQKKP